MPAMLVLFAGMQLGVAPAPTYIGRLPGVLT
ncbi:hypothetical protein SAMN05216603_105276 [Pseudomonas benzenivorans]|nr:hypothetical protein SAMN05216603_105276 [Pseudomonas benzenivorans]